MKIGIISDTHLTRSSPELEALLAGPFREVEVILHAGDITEPAVLESFPGKEVLAVCGNMDSHDLRRLLPVRRVVTAGRFRIGLIHGWGAPSGLEERIRGEFGPLDCIVYGHTHMARQGRREGVYFFNPGSFHRALPGSPAGSVGVLEIGEAISGRILNL